MYLNIFLLQVQLIRFQAASLNDPFYKEKILKKTILYNIFKGAQVHR